MNIIKKHISRNYSKGVYIYPEYIVIHNTDNESKGANAQAHYNYWNTNENANSSIHFVVDDKKVIQLLELNERAWHVGDNRGYSNITNSNTIGIEICVNSDGNFNKAYENAIELVKYLIKITGIPSNKVVRHKDASGKYCPRKIMDLGLWEDFKVKIQGKSYTVVQQARPANQNQTWDDSVRDKKAKIVNIQSYLNVRYEPNGKIIGSLNNGDLVTLWRREGDWYHIYSPVKGYNQAYVHKDYIQVINSSNTTNKTSGKCTPTTELNVRSGPGTNFEKIGMVYSGGELQLHEQNGSWYKISYVTYSGSTKTGWVSSNYVKRI